MKDIVFLNTNHAWGGGEKWHFEMAKALQTRGFKCHIICSPQGELERKSKEANLATMTLKTTNLSFINPFKLIKLYFCIKKSNAKTVFLNLPIDAKLAAIVKKYLNLDKLIYRRGMPHPIKDTKINRFVFEQIDLIIANSLEIKSSIAKNIPSLSDKTKIIYNGVTPLCLKRRELNFGKIRLGNLGRLVEQKGQEHLINIAKLLKSKNFNFSLSIAGSGPLESKLYNLIRKNRLIKEVELVGHQDAADFFNSIDIFLFPSHFEGSANALIEAQQYGVPAVAFNISSMPEVLKQEQHGFLIEPFQEDVFAEKIIELSSYNEIYQEFSQNCLNNIKEHFNYTQKVQQVETLINE